MRRIHGVAKPSKASPVPARVINIESRRKVTEENRIRLDKLLKSSKPVICIKRRLGGIGDVLMTTPLLKAIKTLLPNCHLIYATDLKYSQGALADIINHNPYVDELIATSEVNDSLYDYSVDITATGLDKERSGSIPPNRIDLFADAVGVSIDADPVTIYEVTQEEREHAKKEIKVKYLNGRNRDETNLIAIQSKSNDARRTWPLKNVQELCDLLSEDEKNVVLLFDWGNTVSKWITKKNVILIPDMDLVSLAPIIEQVDLVVCPDISMLHIAGALNKKIVSRFGPIPPESRINHYQNASAITLNLSCRPCWYSPKCTGGSSDSRLECISKITPHLVLKAIKMKTEEEYRIEPIVKHGKDLTTKGQDPIILVRRATSGIGDILMSTVAIDALKKKYPTKSIHVACQNSVREVLLNNPNIDEIIDVDSAINFKRYYMIFDISSPCARYESTRVKMGKDVEKSRTEIYVEATGVRNLISDLIPKYFVTKEEKEEAEKFLSMVGAKKDKPIVAIGLKSAEEYRDWPESKYKELIESLKEDFQVLTLHHTRDHFYEGTIDACGLPIRKAAAILSLCDGLITIDTGILHIGAALEIETIALFGPIDFRPRCKGYKNITVIKADMPCIPCWRNGYTKCLHTGLVKGISKCMESISAKYVAKIAKAKFKKT